jgi:hypothetical protein
MFDPTRPRRPVEIENTGITINYMSLDIMRWPFGGKYCLVATDMGTQKRIIISEHDTLYGPGSAFEAAKDFKFPKELEWEQMLKEAGKNNG